MALSATESQHITAPGQVSQNAAGSTFALVDDRHRAIPAIEFRDVVLAFDERVVLNKLSFKVMKGETKIILGGSGAASLQSLSWCWVYLNRMRDGFWLTAKTSRTMTNSG